MNNYSQQSSDIFRKTNGLQRIEAEIQRGVKCAENQQVLNGAYVVFQSFVDLVLDYCTGRNFIPNAPTGNGVGSKARLA